MKTVITIVVGAALFAILNHFAPFPLEGTPAQLSRISLVANTGSTAIGALVVVLAAGRWWSILLGGLLCPLCGAVVYGVTLAVRDYRFSLSGSMNIAVLNLSQYLLPALAGSAVACAIFALVARLRW